MPSRTDSNQAEIVRALRQVGALVLSLHAMGHGCPDLLVCYRGRLVLLEVKVRKGTLTPDQIAFHAIWPVVVVRSVAEALTVLGVS